MIIDNVEIYQVSQSAEKKYRECAIKDSKININVMQRKLTALILNSQEDKHMSNNNYRYRFGSFILYVNEDTKIINDIEWFPHTHGGNITKEVKKSLEDTYLDLGLNKRGSSLAV